MLIAGNWKMNTDLPTAQALTEALVAQVAMSDEVDVLLCPPFTNLETVGRLIADTPMHLGGQHMHEALSGAYTGEIAAPMLKAVGCSHVILGHSERRQYFDETDEKVNVKARIALEHDLTPIICVGETLTQRESGQATEVVRNQVYKALVSISIERDGPIVLAYEPVWAIGTGHTATPDQAQAMHAAIRGWLTDLYGTDVARNTPILYGGSVKPANAADLFAQPDVDGGLIGGASLKAEDFATLIQIAQTM